MSSILTPSEMQKIDNDIKHTVFGYAGRVERRTYGLIIPMAIKSLVLRYYYNPKCTVCLGHGSQLKVQLQENWCYLQCSRCDGIGIRTITVRCRSCNKKGNYVRNCKYCWGTGNCRTGRCRACDGSGKYVTECIDCDGTCLYAKRVKCRTCDGTGRGKRKVCVGDKCEACDGSGEKYKTTIRQEIDAIIREVFREYYVRKQGSCSIKRSRWPDEVNSQESIELEEDIDELIKKELKEDDEERNEDEGNVEEGNDKEGNEEDEQKEVLNNKIKNLLSLEQEDFDNVNWFDDEYNPEIEMISSSALNNEKIKEVLEINDEDLRCLVEHMDYDNHDETKQLLSLNDDEDLDCLAACFDYNIEEENNNQAVQVSIKVEMKIKM